MGLVGAEAPQTPCAWSGTMILPICHGISRHANVNTQICYRQMCFFKLKIHQNPFSVGLHPGSHWESVQHSPGPPSWLRPHSPPLSLRCLQRLNLSTCSTSFVSPLIPACAAVNKAVSFSCCTRVRLKKMTQHVKCNYSVTPENF